MNGYQYNGGYNGESMDAGNDAAAAENNMMMLGQEGMTFGGQSLDEIVNQNAKAMRRQSLPHQYGGSQQPMDPNLRRISMMEYGSASPSSSMGNYQFDTNAQLDMSSIMSGNGADAPDQRQHNPEQRREAGNNLNVNTAFANSQAYNNLMSAASYQSPAHPQSGYDVSMDSPFLDTRLGMGMDYGVDQNLTPAAADGSMPQLSPFGQAQFNQSIVNSPMRPGSGSQGTPHSSLGPTPNSVGGSRMNTQYSTLGSTSTDTARQSSRHSLQASDNTSSPMHNMMNQAPSSSGPSYDEHSGFQAQPQHPEPGSQHDRGMHNSGASYDAANGSHPVDPASYNPNNQGFNWEVRKGGWPSTLTGRPHMQTSYKNAYSSTGFDMLGVLVWPSLPCLNEHPANVM